MTIKCPHCDENQEIIHDDGFGCAEGVLHIHECDNCYFGFVFATTIVFSYDVYKADCLNGADHNYELTRPYIQAKWKCLDCGGTK